MKLFFLVNPQSQLPRSMTGPPRGCTMKSRHTSQSRAFLMQADLSLSFKNTQNSQNHLRDHTGNYRSNFLEGCPAAHMPLQYRPHRHSGLTEPPASAHMGVFISLCGSDGKMPETVLSAGSFQLRPVYGASPLGHRCWGNILGVVPAHPGICSRSWGHWCVIVEGCGLRKKCATEGHTAHVGARGWFPLSSVQSCFSAANHTWLSALQTETQVVNTSPVRDTLHEELSQARRWLWIPRT